MGKLCKKIVAVAMCIAVLLSLGISASAQFAEPQTLEDTNVLISTATTEWKYLDDNTDPGTQEDRTAWTKADFDDWT